MSIYLCNPIQSNPIASHLFWSHLMYLSNLSVWPNHFPVYGLKSWNWSIGGAFNMWRYTPVVTVSCKDQSSPVSLSWSGQDPVFVDQLCLEMPTLHWGNPLPLASADPTAHASSSRADQELGSRLVDGTAGTSSPCSCVTNDCVFASLVHMIGCHSSEEPDPCEADLDRCHFYCRCCH